MKIENNNFAMLSLVAIVAVVGVISLILMAGPGKGPAMTTPVVMTEDVNTVGEAYTSTVLVECNVGYTCNAVAGRCERDVLPYKYYSARCTDGPVAAAKPSISKNIRPPVVDTKLLIMVSTDEILNEANEGTGTYAWSVLCDNGDYFSGSSPNPGASAGNALNGC